MQWVATERVVLNDGQGNHSTCLVVVCDPDEEGGFNRGAQFSKHEVMLMLNRCAFTPGTILYCPGYGEVVVETRRISIGQRRVHRRMCQVMKGKTGVLVPIECFNGTYFKQVDDIIYA